MARAHRPILAGGLARCAPIGRFWPGAGGRALPPADFRRGAWGCAPIGRFWPGGWVARAYRPLLARGVAGSPAPIGRFWPGGWLGGTRPSADSARGASWVERAHRLILAGGWPGGARPSADSGRQAGLGGVAAIA